EPHFDLKIGWAEDYDSVFADQRTRTTSVRELLDRAVLNGRVLICGKAGSGKTTILKEVMQQALAAGFLPIYLDLGAWTGQSYAQWQNTLKEPGERADFIIRNFSVPKVSPVELDALPDRLLKVLLVDSLNEVTRKAGHEILLALDDFISFGPRLSLIVAD